MLIHLRETYPDKVVVYVVTDVERPSRGFGGVKDTLL
jgi:hypothetical protein